MKLEGAIFDFDGTLLDSMGVWPAPYAIWNLLYIMFSDICRYIQRVLVVTV